MSCDVFLHLPLKGFTFTGPYHIFTFRGATGEPFVARLFEENQGDVIFRGP